MNDRSRLPSLAEQLAAPGGQAQALDRAAEQVMTPGVVALPVTASLDRTAQAMAHHKVHGVLAMTCEGKPAGWVTVEAITPRLRHNHDLDWAVDAIGEPYVSVRPSCSMREVIARLEETGVARVAVSKRDNLMPEGVISALDVAGLLNR